MTRLSARILLNVIGITLLVANPAWAEHGHRPARVHPSAPAGRVVVSAPARTHSSHHGHRHGHSVGHGLRRAASFVDALVHVAAGAAFLAQGPVVVAPPAPVVVVAPPVVVATPAPYPPPVEVAAPPPPPKDREPTHWTFITASAHTGRTGAMGDLELLTEGKRWGLRLGGHGLVHRDAMSNCTTTASLFDVRLAYAPLSGSRGRVRLEAGVSGLRSGDLTTVGPDAGASAELRLLGPIGIEGSVYVTAFPHLRQVSEGGMFLKLGGLRVRGGLRSLQTDALVWQDGALREMKSVVGPYAALSLVF